MSQLYPKRGLRSPEQNQTTTVYPNSSVRSRPEGRCQVALVAGSGQCLTDEISCLLRRRLRVAALIALAGFTAFLVRTFFLPPEDRLSPVGTALHTALVGVLTLASAILWSRLYLSVRTLRALELILFGGMAAFIGYLQFDLYSAQRLVEWGNPDHMDRMFQFAAASNTLHWCVLIVLYGTFIPNTWRRCALVVGVLALTPFTLTFLACIHCPIMGPLMARPLFEMTVLLGISSAIAIFGSYKIAELQEEAFTARKLGQYQLQRRLGSGGMGEVFLGEHMLLRRACAIKIIRSDQAGDPTNLSRFEREVRAMARLTHWNTVEVYDYGHAADGTFYYVMEYLPGLSLQELVERYGPLPPARAVHFLRQMCAALHEAHGNDLIHRDIKPSNVIICQRGGVHDVAKLLDFGLVQKFGLGQADSRLTVQGTILGSPPYMSPEQALGKNNLDARTDIYSLGGLAYFLLTGQAPFVRETAMEMLVAHVHESVTPPTDLRPEISGDLQEVILRCLEKDASKRFADADSLERALADCECGDDWDRDQAAAWWQQRDVTVAVKEVAV
jgi:tRNA A-37 threonylcarbamoyl transferase component Bud32